MHPLCLSTYKKVRSNFWSTQQWSGAFHTPWLLLMSVATKLFRDTWVVDMLPGIFVCGFDLCWLWSEGGAGGGEHGGGGSGGACWKFQRTSTVLLSLNWYEPWNYSQRSEWLDIRLHVNKGFPLYMVISTCLYSIFIYFIARCDIFRQNLNGTIFQ